MKETTKNVKGITLIALVITIIILLILAGISIFALTQIGLLAKTKKAKEKTIGEQLKEEINLAIQSIQIEEIYKGNSVTLETLAGEDGQLKNELGDDLAEAELVDDEINGEYKDYEFTIDSSLNVTINGSVSGAKITGSTEVQIDGYIFEGNTVDIKVTASITGGTITGITAPEGATLKTDTSTTEKVYTVSKNGKYVFIITSDSGKIKKVTAKVENILSTPQITISEVKKDSFKISVENDYPEGAITEYKYSVGGTVKQQGTTDKSYTVTGLTKKTEYSNIKVTAYINSESKESDAGKITTKDDTIEYPWSEIAEIATAISNDKSISYDTETASVTVNGTQKTLNVGDMTTVDGKKVRILGFNHDELTDSKAYGSATATGKAGISFEYVDFVTSKSAMNSTATNSGGWEKTNIRTTLNGTVYEALSIKNYIKAVNKKYMTVHNSDNMSTCSDKLWLLSCGEIWNNGYTGGTSRGLSLSTEGSQYKYYKVNLGDTKYYTTSSVTRKSGYWWLRSPSSYASYATYFCNISDNGDCR